jgi:cytochrome c
MPDRVISLTGMINFCMEVPMEAEPLDVNGPKMKALVAYINAHSSDPNPCAMKNPCMTKNPCAAGNPCAMKNPCASKNPCG